jgi:hypothetical protein
MMMLVSRKDLAVIGVVPIEFKALGAKGYGLKLRGLGQRRHQFFGAL